MLNNTGTGWYSSPMLNWNLQASTISMYSISLIPEIEYVRYYSEEVNLDNDGIMSAYLNMGSFETENNEPSFTCCSTGVPRARITYFSEELPSSIFKTGTNANVTMPPNIAPALNFVSEKDIQLIQISQFMNVEDIFFAELFIANLQTNEIIWSAKSTQMNVGTPAWYSSPNLNIVLYANVNYAVGFSADRPAQFFINTEGGSTDGVIISNSQNAVIVNGTVQCCQTADVYTQLTYRLFTNENSLTSGSGSQHSFRDPYNGAAVNVLSVQPIMITSVAQQLTVDLDEDVKFAGKLVIADLSVNKVIYTSPLNEFTVEGNNWYSVPDVNVILEPYIHYAIGLMTNVSSTVYFDQLGDSEGVLSSFPQNANFLGTFSNVSIDCCYNGNIWTQLTYTFAPTATTFTAGNFDYFPLFGPYPALAFISNTDILLRTFSQYLLPLEFDSYIDAMLVIGDTNSTKIVYTSEVFTLFACTAPNWYTTPSVAVSLQADIVYSIGLLLNVSAQSYIGTTPSYDGILTTVGSAAMNGTFESPSIRCCVDDEFAFAQLTYSPDEKKLKNVLFK